MINCLHHFEILTNSSEKLLNYFIKGFKFNLVNKINLDNRYTQYLINSNSINFLITSLETNNKNEFNTSSKPVKNIDSIYKSSLITIEEYDKNLYNVIKSKNNSAYNVSFKVRDLDRILFNCRKNNVKIIKDRHSIKENVDCAIIRSCIDGVAHTLFDLNNYDGSFLFDSEISNVKQNNLATHFDHLTYATYKDTSTNVIQWYKNIFNMKNIRINKEENAGLIVRTGKSGMNIRAMKYWLCAETGVELKQPINDHQNFKLVISEPLEDDPFNNESAKNQISIFLDENNGPGVQHIGFHTDNIVNSVRETKNNCDQVKYYVTPDSYYDNVEIILKFSFLKIQMTNIFFLEG